MGGWVGAEGQRDGEAHQPQHQGYESGTKKKRKPQDADEDEMLGRKGSMIMDRYGVVTSPFTRTTSNDALT